jgi:hypothetical protein
MDDALLMGELQGIARAREQHEPLAMVELPGAGQIDDAGRALQAAPWRSRACNPDGSRALPLVSACLVDLRDARVMQTAQDLGLVLEATQRGPARRDRRE